MSKEAKLAIVIFLALFRVFGVGWWTMKVTKSWILDNYGNEILRLEE
jgi:hypothetical protein